jgi:predicted GNAT family acetyltransferase
MDDANPTPPSVTRHDDRGRYELVVDDSVVAFAEFSAGDDMITIPYIETDVAQRGNGYSTVLMNGVIDDLHERGLVVRATCAVARAHLTQHAPELLVR